jgi:electron transfer flavoprotein-quinone oxidoreductase
MSSKKWDIIVVGAGCAGSAAAKRAAEKGLKTLLLEKARKPGEKNVSGTNLNTIALMSPDLHYILNAPFERELTALKVYFVLPDRTTSVEERYGNNIALAIRRDEFDNWHAETAAQAGAELKKSTSVVDIVIENEKVVGVVTHDGETIRSEVVIDAGGVNSIVGRKAGLIPKRTGSALILYATVNVKLTKEIIDDRWQGAFEYYVAPDTGYKAWPWIFPKKDSVTLGAGGYMTSDLKNVNEYMQNFLNLPVIKQKLAGGKIQSWGLHIDPDQMLDKKCTGGLILTGDAAGFVMPFVGEGMPEAFRTGIYAADAAAEAIAKRDTSETFLSTAYDDLCSSDMYMQGFRHIAELQKEAALSLSEAELATLMQDMVMGGGFITSYIHASWTKAAEEQNMEKLQAAYDCLQFTAPYRSYGNAVQEEFQAIWNQRKGK